MPQTDKQLIETSLTIIEFTDILVHNLTKDSEVKPVLEMLYSLLSSKAFAIISPDLQPLAHKIFIILDKYRSPHLFHGTYISRHMVLFCCLSVLLSFTCGWW